MDRTSGRPVGNPVDRGAAVGAQLLSPVPALVPVRVGYKTGGDVEMPLNHHGTHYPIRIRQDSSTAT